MNAEFFAAVEDIEKEKGIPRGYMFEKIQQAMLAAFRKDNPEYGENVEVILDEGKKRIELVINKTVVDEVEDPTAELDLDSAHKLSKKAKVGDVISIPVETKKFGRIAAQAAKQVIIQGMLGMNAKGLKGAKVDEKAMARTEAIILSMTPKERENPAILGNSRKKRIAAGSGTSVVEVNRLLKQYDMMLQLVKQMSGNSRKMKKFAKMGGGFPGMPGMGGFPGM